MKKHTIFLLVLGRKILLLYYWYKRLFPLHMISKITSHFVPLIGGYKEKEKGNMSPFRK